ncbi:hypothetical protein FRC02_008635 [Tulasnella sp. 418]|nr:hypothetical protein FRC02_008635 [Tulasnella sp. 418]
MFSKISRSFALFAALLGLSTSAAPLSEKRAGITRVSASTIAGYTLYTQFARAAYCTGGKATWKCGAACKANQDFVIYAGGGDGAATPNWFVGWSPALKSVIVTHQGTDPTQFLSIINDLDLGLDKLDQKYFTGLSSSFYVHGGFQDTFKRSADAVLAAVKKVLVDHPNAPVTTIGHSLGGAIAILNSVFIKNKIPSVTVKTVGYGVPRLANPAFASYLVGKGITRINNDSDFIPILPGRGLGYAHPDGEIHITDDKTWNSCLGQDNADDNCTTGHVASVLLGNIFDHLGAYNGVWIGSLYC